MTTIDKHVKQMSLNEDGAVSSIQSCSHFAMDHYEKLPWLHTIHKKYIELYIADNTKVPVILYLFDDYLRHVKENSRCGPARAIRLADDIIKFIESGFAMMEQFSFVKCDTFYIKIKRLLSLYCELELKGTAKSDRSGLDIATRIAVNLKVFMKDSAHFTPLDILIGVPFAIWENPEIVRHLFKTFLCSKTSFVPLELPDELYIKHLILFKIWRHCERDLEKRNEVDDLFLKNVKPKPSLGSNSKFSPFIPLYNPNLDNDHLKLLRSQFPVSPLRNIIINTKEIDSGNQDVIQSIVELDLTEDDPEVVYIKTEPGPLKALSLPDEIICIDTDSDDECPPNSDTFYLLETIKQAIDLRSAQLYCSTQNHRSVSDYFVLEDDNVEICKESVSAVDTIAELRATEVNERQSIVRQIDKVSSKNSKNIEIPTDLEIDCDVDVSITSRDEINNVRLRDEYYTDLGDDAMISVHSENETRSKSPNDTDDAHNLSDSTTSSIHLNRAPTRTYGSKKKKTDKNLSSVSDNDDQYEDVEDIDTIECHFRTIHFSSWLNDMYKTAGPTSTSSTNRFDSNNLSNRRLSLHRDKTLLGYSDPSYSQSSKSRKRYETHLRNRSKSLDSRAFENYPRPIIKSHRMPVYCNQTIRTSTPSFKQSKQVKFMDTKTNCSPSVALPSVTSSTIQIRKTYKKNPGVLQTKWHSCPYSYVGNVGVHSFSGNLLYENPTPSPRDLFDDIQSNSIGLPHTSLNTDVCNGPMDSIPVIDTNAKLNVFCENSAISETDYLNLNLLRTSINNNNNNNNNAENSSSNNSTSNKLGLDSVILIVDDDMDDDTERFLSPTHTERTNPVSVGQDTTIIIDDDDDDDSDIQTEENCLLAKTTECTNTIETKQNVPIDSKITKNIVNEANTPSIVTIILDENQEKKDINEIANTEDRISAAESIACCNENVPKENPIENIVENKTNNIDTEETVNCCGESLPMIVDALSEKQTKEPALDLLNKIQVIDQNNIQSIDDVDHHMFNERDGEEERNQSAEEITEVTEIEINDKMESEMKDLGTNQIKTTKIEINDNNEIGDLKFAEKNSTKPVEAEIVETFEKETLKATNISNNEHECIETNKEASMEDVEVENMEIIEHANNENNEIIADVVDYQDSQKNSEQQMETIDEEIRNEVDDIVENVAEETNIKLIERTNEETKQDNMDIIKKENVIVIADDSIDTSNTLLSVVIGLEIVDKEIQKYLDAIKEEIADNEEERNLDVINDGNKKNLDVIDDGNQKNLDVIDDGNQKNLDVIDDSNQKNLELVDDSNQKNLELVDDSNQKNLELVDDSNQKNLELVDDGNQKNLEVVNDGNQKNLEVVHIVNEESLETLKEDNIPNDIKTSSLIGDNIEKENLKTIEKGNTELSENAPAKYIETKSVVEVEKEQETFQPCDLNSLNANHSNDLENNITKDTSAINSTSIMENSFLVEESIKPCIENNVDLIHQHSVEWPHEMCEAEHLNCMEMTGSPCANVTLNCGDSIDVTEINEVKGINEELSLDGIDNSTVDQCREDQENKSNFEETPIKVDKSCVKNEEDAVQKCANSVSLESTNVTQLSSKETEPEISSEEMEFEDELNEMSEEIENQHNQNVENELIQSISSEKMPTEKLSNECKTASTLSEEDMVKDLVTSVILGIENEMKDQIKLQVHSNKLFADKNINSRTVTQKNFIFKPDATSCDFLSKCVVQIPNSLDNRDAIEHIRIEKEQELKQDDMENGNVIVNGYDEKHINEKLQEVKLDKSSAEVSRQRSKSPEKILQRCKSQGTQCQPYERIHSKNKPTGNGKQKIICSLKWSMVEAKKQQLLHKIFGNDIPNDKLIFPPEGGFQPDADGKQTVPIEHRQFVQNLLRVAKFSTNISESEKNSMLFEKKKCKDAQKNDTPNKITIGCKNILDSENHTSVNSTASKSTPESLSPSTKSVRSSSKTCRKLCESIWINKPFTTNSDKIDRQPEITDILKIQKKIEDISSHRKIVTEKSEADILKAGEIEPAINAVPAEPKLFTLETSSNIESDAMTSSDSKTFPSDLDSDEREQIELRDKISFAEQLLKEEDENTQLEWPNNLQIGDNSCGKDEGLTMLPIKKRPTKFELRPRPAEQLLTVAPLSTSPVCQSSSNRSTDCISYPPAPMLSIADIMECIRFQQKTPTPPQQILPSPQSIRSKGVMQNDDRSSFISNETDNYQMRNVENTCPGLQHELPNLSTYVLHSDIQAMVPGETNVETTYYVPSQPYSDNTNIQSFYMPAQANFNQQISQPTHFQQQLSTKPNYQQQMPLQTNYAPQMLGQQQIVPTQQHHPNCYARPFNTQSVSANISQDYYIPSQQPNPTDHSYSSLLQPRSTDHSLDFMDNDQSSIIPSQQQQMQVNSDGSYFNPQKHSMGIHGQAIMYDQAQPPYPQKSVYGGFVGRNSSDVRQSPNREQIHCGNEKQILEEQQHLSMIHGDHRTTCNATTKYEQRPKTPNKTMVPSAMTVANVHPQNEQHLDQGVMKHPVQPSYCTQRSNSPILCNDNYYGQLGPNKNPIDTIVDQPMLQQSLPLTEDRSDEIHKQHQQTYGQQSKNQLPPPHPQYQTTDQLQTPSQQSPTYLHSHQSPQQRHLHKQSLKHFDVPPSTIKVTQTFHQPFGATQQNQLQSLLDMQSMINLRNYQMNPQHLHNFISNSQINLHAKQATLSPDVSIPIEIKNVYPTEMAAARSIQNCKRKTDHSYCSSYPNERKILKTNMNQSACKPTQTVLRTKGARKLLVVHTDRITRSSNRTNNVNYKDDGVPEIKSPRKRKSGSRK